MAPPLQFPTDPSTGKPYVPNANGATGFYALTADFPPSPLSGWQQSELIPGGTMFGTRVEFWNLEDELRFEFEAFVDRMQGTAGRVLYGDPDYLIMGPRGALGGAPKVQVGGQTGSALLVYDVTPDVVDWIKRGDYISWAEGNYREMHRIQIDASSSALGEITLNFEPPIRRPPPADTPLLIDPAFCTMKFASAETGKPERTREGWASFAFDLIEAPVNVA